MTRVQAVVVRDGHVLMVRHRQHEDEYWCLPGGRLEEGEVPEQGTLRELREECNVSGTVIRQTSLVWHPPHGETHSFLVDIGDQTPSLGYDPEFAPGEELLVGVRWLRLGEIPERDRAFLWRAGLLDVGGFWPQVKEWGNRISYPGDQVPDSRP
jgi:ADP-ribose pyrophosphatase YjhB (NUDIX family)